MYALLVTTLLSAAPDPSVGRVEMPNLDGTWVFDEARSGRGDKIRSVWRSVVTVTGARFTVTNMGGSAATTLTGRLAFDPADPAAVGLVIDVFDFGDGEAIAAGTYRGRVATTADRIILCLSVTPNDKRPTAMTVSATTLLGTLVRVPAGVKDLPTEVTVRVSDPDGKPAIGAEMGTLMVSRQDAADRFARRTWRLHERAVTGPDDRVKINTDAMPAVVRHAPTRSIAFPKTSPAKLVGGELHIRLEPEHRITGRVTSEELRTDDSASGKSFAFLQRDAERIAQIDLKSGSFDFPVLPGTYTVTAHADERADDSVTVVVPADKSEVAVRPLVLKPSVFARLKGKPAPELQGIAVWAGTPVALADLKGQYVLLISGGFGADHALR